jgi:hypothetical protein
MNEIHTNKIISKNIKIISFSFTDKYLKINTEDNDLNYIININNGSIDADIKTFDKKIVGLKYLEEGDDIKIKGIINENKIIIKKVYIHTKYTFDSESSEDLDLY